MLPLLLSVFASLLLLATLVVFALRRPAYSHIRHTISELGEVGSADGRLVSLGVFLPLGLVLGGIALLRLETDVAVSQLAACLAIGYGVAAFFPCDPGSPLQGTTRQGIHNLGGAVEYVGGAMVLWKLGELNRIGYQGAAVVVGLAALGLSVPGLFSIRGLIQRIAEVILFAALVLSLV